MAKLMPLPLTVSCFSEIQSGFVFLVSAQPGSPGKRAVKRVCVCAGMIERADDEASTRGAARQSSSRRNVVTIVDDDEQTGTRQRGGCCGSGGGDS